MIRNDGIRSTCDCSQQTHKRIGRVTIQCTECGAVTVTRDDLPVVREAERITAASWRLAHRRQRWQQFAAIMIALYGVTLYLAGGLCLALGVVPHHPSIGVLSIIALSVAFIAAGKTWRAWWVRQFGPTLTPYEQSIRRVMTGMCL